MAGALPAAFPNTAEAISAKGGSKLGTRFVGKLEGPTIIVDQSAFPKKFSEAPMLAELVKAGKLPPVEKRLPKSSDLMVIRPVHEIEKFGGRWRGGFTGPGDNENGNRIVSTADDFLFWDKDIYSNKELVPTPAPGIPDQRKIRGHHQERRPYRRL
jgi:peptide/nickel transport system substrate-binding protein